jgi:hypothetical protein
MLLLNVAKTRINPRTFLIGLGETRATTSQSFMVRQQTRKVAIIGSSGGGTATLGHTDGPQLIHTIHDHLQSCNIELTYSCYVALDRGKGMDHVCAERDTAILYITTTTGSTSHTGAAVRVPGTNTSPVRDAASSICTIPAHGTLEYVNNYIVQERLDDKLAGLIQDGTVQGLICISCAPQLFVQTLMAAAALQIPVTGSGGSSLSHAASHYRVRLVGNAGGSVATSTVTRAVSYTYALAHDWGLDYRPWRVDDDGTAVASAPARNEASFTSVLNSCLPIFWGTCLMKALLKVYLDLIQSAPVPFSKTFLEATTSSIHETTVALETWIIPTTCAVIMASSSSSSSVDNKSLQLVNVIPHSSLAMAAIIAASTSPKSLLGGFLAGWLVKQWTQPVLFRCIVWNIPATMSGLISSSGTGVVIAIGLLPIQAILRNMTALIRMAIHFSVSFESPYVRGLSGLVWGMFSCYASKVGWYHSIILPMILVEMELGDPSFVGSVDELTLVLVCAGVCAGYLCSTILLTLLQQQEPDHHSGPAAAATTANTSLCRRGLRINLLYGDFVEACYPFMESSHWVNVAGYLASGLSVAIVTVLVGPAGERHPTATMAYLPYPVALVLSGRNARTFALASLCAFGVPFVASALYFSLPSKANNNKLHKH